ncbi:xanthine dehydrogenase family protein molybdopterin-binding subunit [Parvularcula oceani]|uniref:xanthine dehydrogenase family protein molybdopterin-binding subunit n=1 Tax=Parvularcula oceani TaxID=1247963 RepID=UPI00068AB23E|nr:xanthine dehydrogenase family protein molybdopterin-binding subunit [Parvularcula oceani]
MPYTVQENRGQTDRIGKPHDRIDGRLKVTGDARYSLDFALPNALHSELVLATIGRGRVTGFDLAEAEAVPGVRRIYTHENAPQRQSPRFFGAGGTGARSWLPLQDDRVYYHGEIVALVVADTLVAAREAAAKVKVSYAAEAPAATLDAEGAEVEDPEGMTAIATGDAQAAMSRAATTHEAEYTTPAQHHNAMELYGAAAQWNGENLTVWTPSQFVYGFQKGLSHELGIERSRIRVISPFVGGAFGGKGMLMNFVSLVAGASRELGRPVQLMCSREACYTVGSFRAETAHAVRMGADEQGHLGPYEHTGRELTSRPDTYLVRGTENTVRMYDFSDYGSNVLAVHADRQTPGFMRAPPEVPYFFALESAIDELARKTGTDPVQFRVQNDTQKDPVTGTPFTSRSLVECYEAAGERFGWDRYSPEVGSMTDGDELIGWGVATATYPTQMSPATARVTLSGDGRARVMTAAHDVGTGVYTIFAQSVADKLGVPVSAVTVELGDTELPPGPISGGSITTASSISCIEQACDRIAERLAAETSEGSTPAERMKASGRPFIEEYAEWTPLQTGAEALRAHYDGDVRIVGGAQKDFCAFAFGAEFCEVRINKYTREIRVPRLIGAFAAGRIMNEKTARSQLLGGMIWGIGSALHEETELDPRYGAYMNDNLAEYLVPVNADVQELEAIIVPEVDKQVNPAGVKGIGELGCVGTSAAIANAVYHATGVRVRDLPIRMEKLLPA